MRHMSGLGGIVIAAAIMNGLQRMQGQESNEPTRTMREPHDQPPSWMRHGISRQYRRQMEREQAKRSRNRAKANRVSRRRKVKSHD